MNSQPKRVADLANQWGVLPEEVTLACRFCSRQLNEQDLLAFDYKYFQLLWKDGGVFGCCSACARFLACEEHIRFCRLELPGCDMIRLVHVPLNLILIRCRGCFKVLSFSEKVDMIRNHIFFCSVRGWWRGLCRLCRAP